MTSSKPSSGGRDSSSSTTGRDPGGISIVTMITAFAIGMLAGAALACYCVESEYREFFFH